MNPPKSILDPTFRYVPSHETDLHKTFQKIRKELKKKADKELAELQPTGTANAV